IVAASAQARTQLDELLAESNRCIQSAREHISRLSADQNALAPLAEAKAGRRWWKWRWWRATLRGNVAAEAADLQARISQAQRELADRENEFGCLSTERRQCEENQRVACAARMDAEIARR